MLNCLKFSVFYSFLQIAIVQGLFDRGSQLNCTEVAVREDLQIAYFDWPFTLGCGLFSETEEYSLYDVYDNNDVNLDDVTTCQIWNEDNGTLLLNSSTDLETILYDYSQTDVIILPDLQRNDSVDYEIIFTVPSIGKCYYSKIRLQPKEFQPITCQEFIERPRSTPSSTIGSFKQFYCSLDISEYPKLHTVEGVHDVTTTWFRNCSDLPNDVTITDDNALQIRSVSYDHAGLYTCAVTYNGVTRYIASYGVCVKQRNTLNQHTLRCDQEVVYANTGDDVGFECTGNFGLGSVQRSQFLFLWKNSSDANGTAKLCRKNGTVPYDQRSSCTFDFEDTCYSHIASEAERKTRLALVPVKLILRNVQASDFGSYTITLRSNLQFSEDQTVNVTLQRAEGRITNGGLGGGRGGGGDLTEGQIIGIVVGAVVFVVIVIMIVVCLLRHKRKPLDNNQS